MGNYSHFSISTLVLSVILGGSVQAEQTSKTVTCCQVQDFFDGTKQFDEKCERQNIEHGWKIVKTSLRLNILRNVVTDFTNDPLGNQPAGLRIPSVRLLGGDTICYTQNFNPPGGNRHHQNFSISYDLIKRK